MDWTAVLDALLVPRDLDTSEARALMEHPTGGEASPARIAAALIALRAKGCTGIELAAFAEVLRARAAPFPAVARTLVDTCGTGGGAPSFNLSTAAAIIASAAGAAVAKHGNRAVTSACGSADVLEALGVRLDPSPERAADMLATIGLAFLFAPSLHPAMKAVGPTRRELGVRTVFNQLGPLVNPAGARRQIVGVYDPALLEPMADALALLGAERALVVHGRDGMDELSPCAPTGWSGVWDGERRRGEVSPADFGLEPLDPTALAPAATVEGNGALLREAISDPDSPRFAAVLPGAAAALWVAGVAPDLRAAAAAAREAVASGRAAVRLAEFVEASRQP